MSRVSLRVLWEAWRACRRRKRGTRDCLRYSGRLLDRLAEAQMALEAGTWRPSRARVFVTTRPKAREIHAPAFADRVVHHWLVPQLEAIYEPLFIHDSYANRSGKGTHAAVSRLQTFMRQVTRNGHRRGYALQLDIASYFNSIDRRKLFTLIAQRLEIASRRNPDEAKRFQHIARITRQLLTGNPAEKAFRLGHPSRFDRVPPHKRLANARSECGLAIGNLSSQFFANVYLNELDQFIKHELHCRQYVRYVDDFVLLSDDAEQLVKWNRSIRGFLAETLNLQLRQPVVQPRPVSAGIDFLGYIVRPNYLLPRRRVVAAARQALERWKGRMFSSDGLCLDDAMRTGLTSTIASYWGHFRHASAFGIARTLWAEQDWLHAMFELAWPVPYNRMAPPIATSLAGQRSWFASRFPNAIVWLQVGCSWECYDDHAMEIACRYGLLPAKKSRQGFDVTIAVPGGAWGRWQKRFASDGLATVAAEQSGRVKGNRHGLRKRVLMSVNGPALKAWQMSSAVQ